MLIGRGDSDGSATQSLILGLSRGNVERLLEGRPIRISRKTHGDGCPLGWEIVILYGETEQAIHDELKGIGAIDGVPIHHLPPGAQ